MSIINENRINIITKNVITRLNIELEREKEIKVIITEGLRRGKGTNQIEKIIEERFLPFNNMDLN